ncbi:MAG: prephenate dehydrogenase/arogenate dehydrogenase family protein, partial [Pseudomonadota bacterium]|nr:prephenate dehydrogenase/arogenate dehydrogenase family protein [Pseudomonadota bacterium]
MFGKIIIIVCGFICSSILRATQEKKLAKKISVYDKSNKVIEYLKKNFKVNICLKVSEATKDADLVIISAPLSSYKEILLSIKSSLKEGSILTDTGSAKKEVNKIVNNLGLKNISWIASHPIAGTEYSGPAAGFSSLFKNRWCILSAGDQVAKDKIENLEIFWSKLGSKVKIMSFDDHDYVLSLTSHLPHAVAYSIVRTAINNEDKFKKDVIQYSAGGL